MAHPMDLLEPDLFEQVLHNCLVKQGTIQPTVRLLAILEAVCHSYRNSAACLWKQQCLHTLGLTPDNLQLIQAIYRHGSYKPLVATLPLDIHALCHVPAGPFY